MLPCALGLAHELKERVRFFASDQKLNGVLPLIGAFTANMDISYIQAPTAINAAGNASHTRQATNAPRTGLAGELFLCFHSFLI